MSGPVFSLVFLPSLEQKPFMSVTYLTKLIFFLVFNLFNFISECSDVAVLFPCSQSWFHSHYFPFCVWVWPTASCSSCTPTSIVTWISLFLKLPLEPGVYNSWTLTNVLSSLWHMVSQTGTSSWSLKLINNLIMLSLTVYQFLSFFSHTQKNKLLW